MAMEEAVIQRLLDDAGVAALITDRVFPGSRPQGGELPAIVLNTVSGAPIYDDQGETGLSQSRIQLDCWDRSWLDAKRLARAVRACLSGFYGTIGSVEIQNTLLDSERDAREGGGNAADYPYRTILDFIVWYKL